MRNVAYSQAPRELRQDKQAAQLRKETFGFPRVISETHCDWRREPYSSTDYYRYFDRSSGAYGNSFVPQDRYFESQGKSIVRADSLDIQHVVYSTSGMLRRNLGNRRAPRGILSAYVKVCEHWNLSREDQSLLLGFAPGDQIVDELLDGALPPSSQDIRERVGYVVGISVGLRELFGKVREAELAWLNQSRAVLNGKSPLQRMRQRRMVNLIEISEFLRQERGV